MTRSLHPNTTTAGTVLYIAHRWSEMSGLGMQPRPTLEQKFNSTVREQIMSPPIHFAVKCSSLTLFFAQDQTWKNSDRNGKILYVLGIICALTRRLYKDRSILQRLGCGSEPNFISEDFVTNVLNRMLYLKTFQKFFHTKSEVCHCSENGLDQIPIKSDKRFRNCSV